MKLVPSDVVLVNMMSTNVLVAQVSEKDFQLVTVHQDILKKISTVYHVTINVLLVLLVIINVKLVLKILSDP